MLLGSLECVCFTHALKWSILNKQDTFVKIHLFHKVRSGIYNIQVLGDKAEFRWFWECEFEYKEFCQIIIFIRNMMFEI